MSSFIALSLAWSWGHLTPTISILSLALGSIFAGIAGRRFANSSSAFEFNFWHSGADGWIEKVAFALIGVFCLRHFAWLFYLEDGAWKTLDYHNLGDLPLHINYIRAMSWGNAFPLANPSFAEELLRYPYGIDLYNALWDSLGIPLPVHLIAVGLVGGYFSVIALRAFAGWWGMIGFFLSGGLIGWMGYEFSMSLMQQTAWKNLFLTVLVPQRGFLFALPVGLWMLYQISDKKRYDAISPWWLGFLWGSLAFFHIHSFVAISLMMAYFTLASKNIWNGIKAFFVAGPIGIFFVLFSTDSFRQASVVRLSQGWTFNEQGSFFEYLNYNFGAYLYLYLLILATLIYLAFRHKTLKWIPRFSFYSILFAVFFFVILAPYDWDNVKVLIWAYLGLLSIAYHLFSEKMHSAVKAALALVLSVSGLAVILPTLISTEQAQTLYWQNDIEAAEKATALLSRDAVFFASPDYLHVLTYLGRLRTMGYEGHLFSHGIQYGHQKELMTAIEQKTPADSVHFVKETKADYIFLGKSEAQNFRHQVPFWQKDLKKVSEADGFSVYELKNPPSKD